MSISIVDVVEDITKLRWQLKILNGSNAVVCSFDELMFFELMQLLSICDKYGKRSTVTTLFKEEVDGSTFLREFIPILNPKRQLAK